MKKNKIFSILISLSVFASICFSVFAVIYVSSADDSKTVQLVTLDYIENSLMDEIDEKIQQGSVDSMRESIAAINQALDYLNSQVALNSGNIGNVNGEIASLKTQIQTLNDYIKEVDKKTDQSLLQQQIAALQSRLEALEGACSSLTMDVTTLKDSFKGLSDRITSMESSILALQTYAETNIAALSGRVSTNESGIASLEANALTMKNDLDGLKTNLTDLTALYTALQTRYEVLESEGNANREVLSQMKISVENMQTKINNMSGDYGELIDAYNEYTKTIAALRYAADGGSASFAAIFLKQGETLTCSGLPGDTMELIVRRGTVAVTSPIATQGLLDVTDSVELLNGKNVPEYHYVLIVGGGDGRGIVSLEGDAWILVRGEYEIG